MPAKKTESAATKKRRSKKKNAQSSGTPKKSLKKDTKTHKSNDIPVEAIDIAAMEQQLPPKQPRSHHIIIKFDNVTKTFGTGGAATDVLKNIDLNLYSGEFVIISGPSGSGKSTLLHTLLGLENPSKGNVYMRDENIYKNLTEDGRTRFRREKVGVVFQQSNWIKSLSVLENVAYPLWLAGEKEAAAKKRALASLESVDLAEWANHKPTELSGGQQQRVALARALTNDPGIIVADEPTGNLDTQSSVDIISLLAKLNRKESRMVIMVTHNFYLLPIATRRIVIRDGAVVYDEHD